MINKFRILLLNKDCVDELKDYLNNLDNQDEKKKFLSYTLKSAYDAKKIKSIEYLLSLFPKNEPILLLKIHIGVIFDSGFTKNKTKILNIILNNFDYKIVSQEIDNHFNYLIKINKNIRILEEINNIKIELEKIVLNLNIKSSNKNIKEKTILKI